MKKQHIVRPLLWAFMLAGSLNAYAQPVFDAEACNCNFDLSRWENPDYQAGLPAPYEELKGTFVYDGKRNEVAIGIINELSVAKNKAELDKALTETIAQIKQKPKEAGWVETLEADMRALLPANADAVQNWKPYGYRLACLFTERLHAYYTKYPAQALPAHRIRYEQNVAAADSLPTAPTESTGKDAAAAGGGNSDILFWVMVVLALGGWGFGLMLRGQLNNQQNAVRQSQDQAARAIEQEKQAARNQIAEAESQVRLLQAEVGEWKNKYARLEQENEMLRSKQSSAERPNETEQPAAGVVRYLYAPTGDGVFYMQTMQVQPNSDTFYQLTLPNPQAIEGEIMLICKEENLSRMDAVPQTLLAACDLLGKGKMPYTIGAGNVKAGRVRREGEAWKVIDKIKISW